MMVSLSSSFVVWMVLVMGVWLVSADVQVITSKPCYVLGEDIPVEFTASDALIDDWLGIYVHNTSETALPNIDNDFWLWICGRQTACNRVFDTNVVLFTPTLPFGKYRVFYGRNGAFPPWPGLGSSNVFDVQPNCTTPMPTTMPPPMDPSMSPSLSTPAPVTAAPITAAPITAAPVSLEFTPGPTTASPVTEAPTAFPETSLAPTDSPVEMTTATPTTKPSMSIAPSNTVSPTVMAPVTTAPVSITQAPVTTAPATTAPMTLAPVTQTPVTPAPVTTAPVSPAPVTTAPVSPAPVTTAPVSPAPVTTAPVSPAPVTTAPVSPAPVTSAPTTPAPVTPAPVTSAPTTPAPITPEPTPAPITPAPVTAAPTPAPTPAPTNPTTAVITDKTAYQLGEPINVQFFNQNPQTGDWMGVYPANINVNDLRTGEFWLWHCNRQGPVCPQALSSGTVVFGPGDPAENWRISWPLPVGRYRAVLSRNAASEPWPVIAFSEAFEVQQTPQQAAVQAARSDIVQIINNEPKMAAKFLRLSFHDCVGGCDGCVDLLDIKNEGLLEPIEALQSVVDDHAGPDRLLSRADIWMLSAFAGIDVTQGPQRIDFPLRHIGRVNCEDANTICRNEAGTQVVCNQVRGPFRFVPPNDITTHDLFEFFDNEFGFTVKQTVALMGAHTIGELQRENSGIDGPSGWLINNDVFDNEYYAELVGGSSINDPRAVLVEQAPPWTHNVERNNDLPRFPNKQVWTGFPEGTKIIMLNADIAIVRELTDDNMDENGVVSCAFVGASRCPVAERSFQFAAEYTFDNLMWLLDFARVMEIMTTKGYVRSNCTEFDVCSLTPI